VSRIANGASCLPALIPPLSSPTLGRVASKRSHRPTHNFFKRLVDSACGRLGFQLIPSWRAKTLAQSQHLRNLLEQLDIDTVLDVGANVGGFWNLLRTFVGYEGQIISFEPVPEVYDALVMAASRDRSWKGLQVALGDTEGELHINVTQRSTMSSFLSRDVSMLRSHGYEHLLRVTEVVRTQPVRIRTLDSVLKDFFADACDPRIFLKCDTQGYDLKVIAGATRTLQSVLALQIELSIKPIYEGAPHYVAVLEHLSELGFDITAVFPVRRDELSRIVNFDCVMINSRHPAVQALAAKTVCGRTPE
jgi:FkbM family methyltransferase